MKWRALLTATAVGALTLVAAPADAAFSLKYVQGSRVVKAGTRASKIVLCPSRWTVVGGGVDVEGGNGFTRVAGTTPVDGRDRDRALDDGWKGTINNATAEDRSMTTYAVCANGGRYRRLRLSETVGASTRNTRDLTCPAGQVIVGGGVSIKGGGLDAYLLESVPSVQQWYGSIANDSADDVTQSTFAICSTNAAFGLTGNNETLQPDAAAQEVDAPCPSGTRVVSGGGSGGTLAAPIHSLEPSDSLLDIDTIRDDAWSVKFIVSGAAENVTVAAVCRAA